MYAIIRAGGKQYRVEKGDVVRVERLEGKVGICRREGRCGSKPFQCDDETSPGVQRLVADGHLSSIDTAKGGLEINKVS